MQAQHIQDVLGDAAQRAKAITSNFQGDVKQQVGELPGGGIDKLEQALTPIQHKVSEAPAEALQVSTKRPIQAGWPVYSAAVW